MHRVTPARCFIGLFFILASCARFSEPYTYHTSLTTWKKHPYITPKVCRPFNYPNPEIVKETARESCQTWITKNKEAGWLTWGRRNEYRIQVEKISTDPFLCPLNAFMQEQFICHITPLTSYPLTYRKENEAPIVLASPPKKTSSH